MGYTATLLKEVEGNVALCGFKPLTTHNAIRVYHDTQRLLHLWTKRSPLLVNRCRAASVVITSGSITKSLMRSGIS